MSINCIRTLLESAVETHADKTAIVLGNSQVSYAELFKKVNQVALYLKELDLPIFEFISVTYIISDDGGFFSQIYRLTD